MGRGKFQRSQKSEGRRSRRASPADTSDGPGRDGAHVRAREEAAWGVGAPQATSRGLGQSPS